MAFCLEHELIQAYWLLLRPILKAFGMDLMAKLLMSVDGVGKLIISQVYQLQSTDLVPLYT